jgi:vacuolar-type H+-ATPase subunit H
MSKELTTQADESISQHKDFVGGIVDWAKKLAIKTKEHMEEASGYLGQIKSKTNEIEDERKSIVQPVNDSVRKINRKYIVVTGPLKEAERTIKDKMRVYVEAEEAKVQKKLEKAKPGDEPPPAPDTQVRTDEGVTSVRKVWVHDLVDIKQLPDEFKTIDNVAVKKAIDSGVREIPGLKIYQRTDIAHRT